MSSNSNVQSAQLNPSQVMVPHFRVDSMVNPMTSDELLGTYLTPSRPGMNQKILDFGF